MHRATSQGIAFATALVLAATPLLGQQTEPARQTHPGRVLDDERKPVADAVVLLVAPAECGGLVAGDVVRATTDAAGRFRAALQPARSYVAWASAVRGEHTHVSTQVDIGADATELVLERQPASTRITFPGIAAWRDAGPLRVQIDVHGCESLAVNAPLDGDGHVAIPPLPRQAYPMRMFCADRLVHTGDVSPYGNETLPPPHRLRLRVADDKGAPIAGAVVHRTVFSWPQQRGPFPVRPPADRFEVATTAADGTAEVLVAGEQPPLRGDDYATLLFVATKAGHVAGLAGRVRSAFSNARLLDAKELDGGVLPFVLRTSEPQTVTIQPPANGAPAALQWLGQHTVPYEKDSHTSLFDGARLVPVAGRLALPQVQVETGEALLAIPVQLPPLAADDPWGRLVRPMTLVVPRASLPDNATIDLRNVQPLRLQVLDAGGGPAMAAAVLCAPQGTNEFLEPGHGLRTTTDRSGRALLPALPGSWIVAAHHGTSFVQAVIEVQPGLPPQTLKLEPLARMRVVVRNGDGKPVVNVAFDSNGASWSGGGSPPVEWLRRLAWPLTTWSLQQARSDADGRADLFFLPAPGLQMRVRASLGGRFIHMPRLEVSEEPVEVILQ